MFKALFRSVIPPESKTQFQNITAQELKKRLDAHEPLILVDVRTPEEYKNEGHIPGSLSLPLATLRQTAHQLEKEQTVVCICRSGSRSQTACEQLAIMGFTKLINLSGGMMGWQRVGHSVK